MAISKKKKQLTKKALSKKTKTITKKSTTKKAATKSTKQSAPKEGTIIFKAMEVYKANKKLERKEIIVLISKKLKCTVVRAGQIYQSAKRRVEDA